MALGTERQSSQSKWSKKGHERSSAMLLIPQSWLLRSWIIKHLYREGFASPERREENDGQYQTTSEAWGSYIWWSSQHIDKPITNLAKPFSTNHFQAVFSTENLSRIHMNLDIYITTTWLMASPLFLCVPICLPTKKKWATTCLAAVGHLCSEHSLNPRASKLRELWVSSHGPCSSRAQDRRWFTAWGSA